MSLDLRALFFNEKDTKITVENVRTWTKKTENGIQLLLSFIESYDVRCSTELTTIFCILNSRFNNKLCNGNESIISLVNTLVCSPHLYCIREKEAEILHKIIRKWSEFDIFSPMVIDNLKLMILYKVSYSVILLMFNNVYLLL